MAKQKNRNKAKMTFNEKAMATLLKNISDDMNNIKKNLGKKGDGAANAQTLIGAIERLNDVCYDGKTLCDVYDTFNDSLGVIRTRFNKINSTMNAFDTFNN